MPKIEVGTQLNERYRLDAEIGQGGMGVIYRAHDTLLDRDVAIKVLTKASQETAGRERLLREAQAAARLNHPHIVAIHDVGEADGLPFIIMELVEGASLYDHASQGLDEVVAIARQICAALEHAHNHEIVHRDLKPENVLVASDGSVKLTDFGLARSVASRLTTEGSIAGTVFYLAPEVALGQPIDGRADLYSFGVMLYELTAGRLPFEADDPLALISQHLYSSVVPPSTHNPAIPPVLDALIIQLMSKRPTDRPASAAAVDQRLALLTSAAVSLPADVTGAPTLLDRIARGRLVGRVREVTEITAHWRRAAAGNGHVLLVSGEPGVGKTRLVRELVALVEVSRSRALVGECYAEGGPPYAPFAQIIRETLDQPDGDLGLPDYALSSLLPLTPELTVRYAEVAPNPPLEPQAEQQRLFESVVALCNALTAQAPLLLFVEDIHWADSGTLFLLRYLARRMRHQPMLFVMTYREVELDQACCLQDVMLDLTRERLATRLKLTRLDRNQTEEMLATMLIPSGEIAPDFVDSIYRETEGNPFFIEELCKALIEVEKVVYQEGRWVASHIEEMAIPQSVRMTIASRLGRLPPAAQDVVRLGAVIGREFSFDVLRQASDLDEDTLIDALEQAEKAQIIVEVPRGQRGSPTFSFAFAHALIPSTLREGIGTLRRHRLHRRAAEAIAAVHPDDLEALAFQYEQAGDADCARFYYTRAGDRALSVYANREAERHYQSAMELAEEETEQSGLLSVLGESLFRQSRYQEAIAAWRQAIELCRDRDDCDNVAWLYARAARAAWHDGDAPGGLDLCQEGMAAIPGKTDSPGLAALLHETGRAYFFNQMPDKALPLCQQALEMSQRLGLVDVQADALATLGVLPNQPPEEATSCLEQALELAESAGLPEHAMRAHINLGSLLGQSGDYHGWRAHSLKAAELARKTGNISWELNYLILTTDTSLALADLTAVEQTLPVLERLSGELPDPGWLSLYTHCLEAYLQRARGQWDEATRLMQACQEEAQQLDLQAFLVAIHCNLAEMLIELGRLDEADAVLEEVLGEDAPDLEGEAIWPYTVFSSLRSLQGRAEEARQLLQRAQGISPDQIYPLDRVALLWAEAALAQAEQRLPEALDALERAIAVAENVGARWHQARLLRDQAGVYLARGESADHTRAKKLLRRAGDLFQQIESPGYAALIGERLKP
jgi:tetratricopeptide (TPR) repeat protein